jgi:hypothetical protein
MTQQVIQVGAQPNDGQGSPLRNSFIITNENFTQLYARAQTTPPTTLVGKIGDQAGWYAYDSTYFYYCFADYDGSSTIWAQISQIGNVTVTTVQNGTSNVKITDINGNVTTGVNGFSNVVTVAATGQYIQGVVSAIGNITGSYILGNGSQLTGLPATYTNANTTALLANFGSNTISSTGNITSGNLSVTNTSVTVGNVTGGNLTTGGQVSAVGNIVTDQYFVGNFFGNVTGNFVIPGSNTQVVFNTAGNADAVAGMTFNKDSNTFIVLGIVSSQGNVISGNLTTSGQVTATGNVRGGNILTGGVVSAAGNVTGGNISAVNYTGTTISITGNVTSANVSTGGVVSATGNISSVGNVSGNYLRATLDVNAGGNVSATTHTGTAVSVTGNVTGGNVVTGGQVSAVGNITGNHFLGNGSALTGLNSYGNSNVNTLLAAWGSNTVSTTGTITAGNITGDNLLTGGVVSVTGNVAGGNVLTAGQVTATGNISGNYFVGNGSALTDVIAVGIGTIGSLSVTGNITAGNVTVSTGTISVGSITNNNSNAVGNIGSASNYFNTVFAKATSAQYADLAENYLADAEYTPGTVVVFGGEQEITISTDVADERVAGAISTNPAHLMNAAMPGLPVALRGRVPVNVVGSVVKGDSLVTSSIAGHAQSVGRSRLYGQAVFAKALETNLEDGKKVIIAVII